MPFVDRGSPTRRQRLARLGRDPHEQPEEAVELRGVDRRERQLALHPHLALARVREAHERDLAVPAQQVARVERARLRDLGLRAQQPVAQRHADVQRPSAGVDGEAPLVLREAPRLAVQCGDVAVDDVARVGSSEASYGAILDGQLSRLAAARPASRTGSGRVPTFLLEGDHREVK